MAAFDFPSSPSVNQTYTANGVTWKWNGTMWMRVSGAGYLEKIEEGNSKVEVDDSGSGNVTVTTDGTEKLRITSAGNIGIGTDNPSNLLHVYGQARFEDYLRGTTANNKLFIIDDVAITATKKLYFDTGSNTYIDEVSADTLRFTTGGTERLRITSDGKTGVGVASPLNKFHVYGANTIARFQSSTSYVDIQFQNTGATNGFIQYNNSGNFRFYANSGSTPTLDITAGAPGNVLCKGKLSIGDLTNPVAKLHIGTEDDAALTAQTVFVEGAKTGYANYTGLPQNQLCLYDNTTSTAGSGGAISFGANCGGSQQTWIAAIESQRDSGTNDASNYAGSIVFWTRPAQSTPTEKLRITSGGLVGIATAVPSYRLDIGDGVTDPANGHQLRVNAAGDYIFALQKQSNASFSIRNNSTGIVHLNTQNSKILSLGVSSGNASGSIEDDVRIDSNGHLTVRDGNLVIGTSGHGIDFSAAGNASGMSSELLDDYEEGTFTPTLITNGGTGSVQSYGQRAASYTKIGRQVTCFGRLAITNKGTLSGGLAIGNLPFTIANTVSTTGIDGGGLLNYFSGVNSSHYTDFISANPIENTTYFVIYRGNQVGALSGMDQGHINSNFDCRFTITYFTAS